MSEPPPRSLKLPHTAGCLACGQSNPHGLHLNLTVDPATGVVRVAFTPARHHIGFQGIAHGGVLATVFDEAMVWAASWHGKRFCVCGELTVRFRQSAVIDQPLAIEARVINARARIVQTTATMRSEAGELIAEGSAKYVPAQPEQHRQMTASFVEDATTAESALLLCAGLS